MTAYKRMPRVPNNFFATLNSFVRQSTSNPAGGNRYVASRILFSGLDILFLLRGRLLPSFRKAANHFPETLNADANAFFVCTAETQAHFMIRSGARFVFGVAQFARDVQQVIL